jgi:branched-chain amino acid transport system ATP-binding protein
VLLEVNDIHTYYGESHILQGVSLEIRQEESVSLLGRNGVGKSTLLKSIAGLIEPRKGAILFKGRDIAGLKPHRICRLGIGYVPEERRIFPKLSVRQNLLVGIKPGSRPDNPWTIENIYSFFPRLADRNHQRGGNLSGGEQQMLTIGRTLMGNPEALLVDEPTEGLAPLIVEKVREILTSVKEAGVSILLVEQSIDMALALADKVYVMSKGQIVFNGTGDEIKAAKDIRRRYLEV